MTYEKWSPAPPVSNALKKPEGKKVEVKYYFDSKGNWIAFQNGKYLFNNHGRWIGWFISDDIAVDTDGKYLATVYLGDRLLVNLLKKKVKYPDYPGHPGYVSLPPSPGYKGLSEYVPNTEDVEFKFL